MDKNIKYFYISKFIISLIMLLLILTFSFIPLFNTNVYAEEIIYYNFNQLSNFNNESVTGTATISEGSFYYINNLDVSRLFYNSNYYDNHKYYYNISLTNKSSNVSHVMFFINNYTIGISSGSSDIQNGIFNLGLGRTYCTDSQPFSYTINVNMIDLTLMFGEGNEPDITQCRNMFVTNYNYTINSVITNNDFNSYNNGYKDALNSFDYKLNTSQTYNSFESGDTIEYPAASIIGYATPAPLIYPVYKPSNPEYILQPTYYQVRVNKYGRLRLGTEIDKGASVNIKGMISGEYNTGLTTTSKINICILDYQNNLVVLKTIELPSYTGNKQINYTNFEVNFTLSGNTESLYFTCDNLSTNTNNTYFYLGDIEISTKILNTSQLIENSYNTGYDTGYNNGYDIGYKNGINTKGESVWQNSMAFIKNIFVNIFDIFNIEILPNVSLGTFIIIPLIFSILFFIVKIAKGG